MEIRGRYGGDWYEGLGLVEPGLWVDGGWADTDFPMEMGTGAEALGTDTADEVAGLHDIPIMY